MRDPEIKSDQEADVALDLAVERAKIAHEKVFGVDAPRRPPDTVWDRFAKIAHNDRRSSN